MEPHIEDAHAWAEAHFTGTRLGDRRRSRRLMAAAAVLANRPEGTLPQRFALAPLRAVYRLCNRPEVTRQAVTEPHLTATREAIGATRSATLILHDSTELVFTSHHALTGLGQTGNGRGRGLLQHNSLAIDAATGMVHGLIAQQVSPRPKAPKNESRAAREGRERQSQVWARGVRAAGRPVHRGDEFRRDPRRHHKPHRQGDPFPAPRFRHLNGPPSRAHRSASSSDIGAASCAAALKGSNGPPSPVPEAHAISRPSRSKT